MKKVQWEKLQKKNQDIKKQEEEAEKTAMAQIDWHDFTVVQTIDFDDEADEVPEENEGKAENAGAKEPQIFSQLPPQQPPKGTFNLFFFLAFPKFENMDFINSTFAIIMIVIICFSYSY